MKQFTRAALSAFMIVLGVALSAFAMSVFVLPFDILAPGVTGLGRTLGIYFGADVSLVVWISNIALLLLGLVVLGWRFAASIVLGSVCFPLFLDLFDAMPWLSAVLSDPLYAAICAGVLEGVGLGLYLVKSILDAHNEDIAVTSRDGVTEFVFTLRLAAKQKPEKPKAEKQKAEKPKAEKPQEPERRKKARK